MFIAAAPYFQYRFDSSPWILQNFQPSITVASSIVNLMSMIILTRLQENASYPGRIIAFLLANCAIFLLLTLFAVTFLGIGAKVYFGILLVLVSLAAGTTALAQNGAFALSSGSGREEYTQAIMAGQGIAGVAPCIVQIALVLSVSSRKAENGDFGDPSDSAFGYFLAATAVSAVTLMAFLYLMRHRRGDSAAKRLAEDAQEAEVLAGRKRKSVGMWTIFKKLRWFASSVIISYAISMLFPVFAQEIFSVQSPETTPRILQPATFIPLAILAWNTGSLFGRYAPFVPAFNLLHAPKTTFFWAIARIGFVPIMQLCNIKGRGAVIESDFFYLVIVQGLFGFTDGWIGTTCLMAGPIWVDEAEREAAGSFMGLALVVGLTLGSFLSFLVA